MALGGLPGVLETRSRWIGKEEVVEVLFDEQQLTYAKLLQLAQATIPKSSTVFCHDDAQLKTARAKVGSKARQTSSARDAKASDQHYRLSKSRLDLLPATALQRTKMNAALGQKTDPLRYLSPTQRTWARRLRRAKDNEIAALPRRKVAVSPLAWHQWWRSSKL